MRLKKRAAAFGLAVLAAGAGAWALAPAGDVGGASGRSVSPAAGLDGAAAGVAAAPAVVPPFGDGFLEDSGYELGYLYTSPVADRSSIAQAVAASRGRLERGLGEIEAELGRLPETAATAMQRSRLNTYAALLHMYAGRFDEADPWIARAIGVPGRHELPADLIANLTALRGVAALRRGELDNCVACLGPSSCIFPLDPAAVHAAQAGSRAAFGHFLEYLEHRPEDLAVRWLLNVTAMTLGEYPDGVPSEFRLPMESVGAEADVGRFDNVAAQVGLGTRGPNMAGGAIFDDFNGDGRPDILTSTTDWEMGGALFLNRGDGTFADRSAESGLGDQPMAINAVHADYDNDGDLDVLMLRGGWEHPYRMTLLRNRGDGTFDDATEAAGLARPIATQSAAWGDYDNDGDVDLYVCGEFSTAAIGESPGDPTRRSDVPENLGRLYRNDGDGTFTDVAAGAGVTNRSWGKGCAWGDFDDDGDPDLYVSNMHAPNRLYRNDGGTFTDVAQRLGVDGPFSSFACWFFDYDNDGRLDLFVAGYRARLSDYVAAALGGSAPGGERSRLYRNLGPDGFRDVTAEAGLDRILMPMGANFGDIDNDGYLDIYLGTGRPHYSYLMPNVLLKNEGGGRFADISATSGTGHLQKGHGIGFADYDRDGDLDLFAELGGATPGDKAHNALFRNPGHGRHWLRVKLVGTTSNRAAMGARLRLTVAGPDGADRLIHRQVGGGSSFGGNPMAQHFGLGEPGRADVLTVTWPASGIEQVFRDLPVDREIEITEGSDEIRILD